MNLLGPNTNSASQKPLTIYIILVGISVPQTLGPRCDFYLYTPFSYAQIDRILINIRLYALIASVIIIHVIINLH